MKQTMNIISTIKGLSEIDFQSTLEERVSAFKDNYKNIQGFDPHSEDYFDESFIAICNITAAICDEDDYIFGSDGIMIEECYASELFNDVDDAWIDKGFGGFAKVIHDHLLKKEKYEFLNAIKQ
jgi:hypothetical protein